MKKKRLDILLLEKDCFATRSRAQAEIMAGKILVDGVRVDKAGALVDPEAELIVRSPANPYVSRGGLKLRKALVDFSINLRDLVILDIGASTGGFTDCLLKSGALKVYAVDVGYGQLHWILRKDKRVVNMERKNFRYLSTEDFTEQPSLATVDVSFISLGLVFPVLQRLAIPEAVVLIKPQFEAGPENVGKHGVVRSPDLHLIVIEKIIKAAALKGFEINALTFSPLRGARGNIEYLAYFTSGAVQEKVVPSDVVNEAHSSFHIGQPQGIAPTV